MTDVIKLSFSFQFLKTSFSKLKLKKQTHTHTKKKTLLYLKFFLSSPLVIFLPSCFLPETLFLQTLPSHISSVHSRPSLNFTF